MRHYSLYLLQPGKRVGKPVDLDCETDASAIDKALSLRDRDMSLELWQGTRLVKRMESTQVMPAPPAASRARS